MCSTTWQQIRQERAKKIQVQSHILYCCENDICCLRILFYKLVLSLFNIFTLEIRVEEIGKARM